MTDVSATCVGVIFRINVIMVIQLVFIAQCSVCGWLIVRVDVVSPEKDCCWLRTDVSATCVGVIFRINVIMDCCWFGHKRKRQKRLREKQLINKTCSQRWQ